MKAKDKILSAVVLTAAALCASCSTDDLTAQQQGQGGTKAMSLTATLDGTQTRTGLNSGSDNTHTLYWHDSDQILVRTKSTADNSYEGVKFDIAEGTATGVTTATFNGMVSDKNQIDTYAVYPYDADHKFTDENSLTFHLPDSYTYTTVETGIFPKDGTYRTINTCVPMLGTISDGTAKFKHLGGLLVIRIDQMPAEAGTLTVSANEQLSGNFTVSDLSASDAKIATTTTDTEADKTVTFTFSGASQGNVGVFYLPVATGSYSGVKITVASTGKSTTSTMDYGSVSVSRAGVTAIPLYNNNGTIGKDIDKSCTIGGHWFVDLGLPSGLLWAETNVGATNSYDFGNYYLCGEADGAARSWSSSCSLPTKDNFEELISNCSWTWATENGVNGYKVTGKKDGYTGNSIFLPAAGYGEYYMDFDMNTMSMVVKYHAYLENQQGYYWSTSTAQSLVFDYNSKRVDDIYYENKARVRPVAK